MVINSPASTCTSPAPLMNPPPGRSSSSFSAKTRYVRAPFIPNRSGATVAADRPPRSSGRPRSNSGAFSDSHGESVSVSIRSHALSARSTAVRASSSRNRLSSRMSIICAGERSAEASSPPKDPNSGPATSHPIAPASVKPSPIASRYGAARSSPPILGNQPRAGASRTSPPALLWSAPKSSRTARTVSQAAAGSTLPGSSAQDSTSIRCPRSDSALSPRPTPHTASRIAPRRTSAQPARFIVNLLDIGAILPYMYHGARNAQPEST